MYIIIWLTVVAGGAGTCLMYLSACRISVQRFSGILQLLEPQFLRMYDHDLSGELHARTMIGV